MTIQLRPDGLIFADGAKNGEVESFPNLLRGWGITLDQTEGIPPMEWFNDLFQRQDKAIKYLLQQGISEWSDSETYPVDAVVKFEGKTWQAIQENTGSQPQQDSIDWVKFGNSYSKIEADERYPLKTDVYPRTEADSTFAKLTDFRHEEYGDTDIFYLPNGLVIQGFTGTSGAWVNYPVALSFVFPAIACAGYTTTQSDSITVADYNNTSMFVVMRNGTGGGINGKFNALVIGKEL